MTSFGSRPFRARRVKSLREMARHDAASRALLARELVLWSKESLERGRTDLALSAAEEAVAINRERAAESSRNSKVALAESLQMVALLRCELERFDEAEPAAAESVALVRDLRAEQSNKQVESMLRTGLYLLTACAAHDGVNGEGATPIGDDQSEPP
jgi:hypothetical protein